MAWNEPGGNNNDPWGNTRKMTVVHRISTRSFATCRRNLKESLAASALVALVPVAVVREDSTFRASWARSG